MKNLSPTEVQKLLESLSACRSAVEWSQGKDLYTIIKTCERGDWLLWLAGRMISHEGWLSHKEVVSIACDCAETSLKYVKEGENRPQHCIDVVRLWIASKASIEDVHAARHAAVDAAAAAYAAVDAAYAAVDADAAYAYAYAAAVDAAYAAYTAAYAAAAVDAAYAADAAYTAAYAAAAVDAAYAADAAYAYAADAARKQSLLNSADICHKYFKLEE